MRPIAIVIVCVTLMAPLSAGTILVDFTANEAGEIAVPDFLSIQGATNFGALHNSVGELERLPQLLLTFRAASPLTASMDVFGDGAVVSPGCNVSATSPGIRNEIVCATQGGDFSLMFWSDSFGTMPGYIEIDNLRITGDDVSLDDLILAPVQNTVQFGDTNADNAIDLDDLNNVRNYFGDTGSAWDTSGDTYPFDGFVDIRDLNAVRNNLGSFVSIPEPSSLALLAAAAACVSLFRAGNRIIGLSLTLRNFLTPRSSSVSCSNRTPLPH